MSTQDTQNRYIVIVGKIGNGKSSSGNTLVGKQVFQSKRSLNYVTNVPEKHSTERNGKTYTFVDTPGFFDPDVQGRDVLKAVQQSVMLCPHVNAFLLVFDATSRLDEDDVLLPYMLSVAIGQSCLKRIIVLFTHGSEFTSNEQFIEFTKESRHLITILSDCSGIVCRIENGTCQDGNAEAIESIFNDAIERVFSNTEGPLEWTQEEFLVYEKVFMEEFVNNDEKLKDQLARAMEKPKSKFGFSWKDIALFLAGVVAALVFKRPNPILSILGGAVIMFKKS